MILTEDTKIHFTGILDWRELLIAQFTEQTSAIKFRGKSKYLDMA